MWTLKYRLADSLQDRSNIGLAKIAGMEDDLNLSSNQYYIAVVIWVIGYTIGEVPSKYGLPTFSPSPISV